MFPRGGCVDRCVRRGAWDSGADGCCEEAAVGRAALTVECEQALTVECEQAADPDGAGDRRAEGAQGAGRGRDGAQAEQGQPLPRRCR
eukprot:1111000-Rhodomonas_salina.1